MALGDELSCSFMANAIMPLCSAARHQKSDHAR